MEEMTLETGGQEANKKRCRKCLLREMDREAYMDNLYDYIRRLDEDIKADQALYEERLSVRRVIILRRVCAGRADALWSCAR